MLRAAAVLLALAANAEAYRSDPVPAGAVRRAFDERNAGSLRLDGAGDDVEAFYPDAPAPKGGYPMLMALHGLCMNAPWLVGPLGFDLVRFVDALGFVLVAPSAPVRNTGAACLSCGAPFFGGSGCLAYAASPSCCAKHTPVGNFSQPNHVPRSLDHDVEYLMAARRVMVDRRGRGGLIDRSRVYLFGFSNGGFMAYRLLCTHPGAFRGAVTVAAAANTMPADAEGEARICPASARRRVGSNSTAPSVRILHVHGSVDDVIKYGGGPFDGHPYVPSAEETARLWAAFNWGSSQFDGTTSAGGSLDLLRAYAALAGPVTVPFPLTNEWIGASGAYAAAQAERAAAILSNGVPDLSAPPTGAYRAQRWIRRVLGAPNETTVESFEMPDDGRAGEVASEASGFGDTRPRVPMVELWTLRGQGHNLFQTIAPDKLVPLIWQRLAIDDE